MKGWKVLCGVVALCVPVAAAAQEEGPAPAPKTEAAPAKHENKVTDAAKAAFEKAEKVRYSPVKAGLKELTGTLKMAMEGMPGGGGAGGGRGGMRGGMRGMGDMEFTVAFKAPAELKVEAKEPAPSGEDEGGGPGGESMARMMAGMRRRMVEPVTTLFKTTFLGLQQEGEYDADVRVEGGVSTLLVTSYDKGVESGRAEFVLGENGLPVSGTILPKAREGGDAGGDAGGRGGRGGRMRGPGGAEKTTVKYTWAKAGDLFRLEKTTFESPMGAIESNLRYADASGMQVLCAWETKLPGGMAQAYRFTDLSVNGKPVALPKVEEKEKDGTGEDDGDGEDDDGDEGGMGGK